MTKTYELTTLLELIPMKRESYPLSFSHDPFTDGLIEWIVRYIIDDRGLWLQVNDAYGGYQQEDSRLSRGEIKGMTGLDIAALQESQVDGVGCRFGYPGGRPILPIPFTAAELVEFDKSTRALSNQLGDGEFATDRIAELEKSSPDAAALARFILKGEVPADKQDNRISEKSVKVWTVQRIDEAQAYRNKHGLKKTAEHYGVSETTISAHTKSPKKGKNPSAFNLSQLIRS